MFYIYLTASEHILTPILLEILNTFVIVLQK